MRTLKISIPVLAVVGLVSLLLSFAFTSAGVVSAQFNQLQWGPWRFNYGIDDSSGLALRYVYYNNEFVIYKASMPVIRVHYLEPPAQNVVYADRISSGNLHQRTFTVGGRSWLELGVFTRIGGYEIYQAWYLSNDGYIQPHLFSCGLHHQADHNHHVYWRMDFDINGAGSDHVFVYDNNRPSEGWGPGWHEYPIEVNDIRNPPTNRLWFVRDSPTGHGIWIFPGGGDGVVDSFSTIDMGGRQYRYGEDNWIFGGWGELGWNEGEDIQLEDVVFWYVAHLHHQDEEGPSVWHSGGPTLLVHR